MQRHERLIIIILGLIIAISLFLFSLKGRYQYVDGISHDTWTGKVYVWGTKCINVNKPAPNPFDDFVPLDK